MGWWKCENCGNSNPRQVDSCTDCGTDRESSASPAGYVSDVKRAEDMSPRGHLHLSLDGDGDVIVAVKSDDGTGRIIEWASVEFCTVGIGGGGSPRTYKALRALMVAMAEDNADPNCKGRSIET